VQHSSQVVDPWLVSTGHGLLLYTGLQVLQKFKPTLENVLAHPVGAKLKNPEQQFSKGIRLFV
jgi:hypothetical protein